MTALELVHILSDVVSFLGYGFVCLVAVYVYTRGSLSSVAPSYPDLWRLGIVFLALSALVRLSSSLQMSLGILAGVDTIYLTITIKLLLAVIAILFSWRFWSHKDHFIVIGRIWKEVIEQTEEKRW